MTYGKYAQQRWTVLDGMESGDERKRGYDELLKELDLAFEPYMNDQLGWSFRGLIKYYGAKKTFAILDWPKYEMNETV